MTYYDEKGTQPFWLKRKYGLATVSPFLILSVVLLIKTQIRERRKIKCDPLTAPQVRTSLGAL